MKFKFENGTIVDTNDVHIINILRNDKRYTEVKLEKVVVETNDETQVAKPKKKNTK